MQELRKGERELLKSREREGEKRGFDPVLYPDGSMRQPGSTRRTAIDEVTEVGESESQD